MKKLTFFHWYCHHAVYLDGELIWFGEWGGNFTFLRALGYECSNGPEVPTHNIPPEFDRDPKNGWWKPPQKLETLAAQFDKYNVRLKKERIADLEGELIRLRAERKPRGGFF